MPAPGLGTLTTINICFSWFMFLMNLFYSVNIKKNKTECLSLCIKYMHLNTMSQILSENQTGNKILPIILLSIHSLIRRQNNLRPYDVMSAVVVVRL